MLLNVSSLEQLLTPLEYFPMFLHYIHSNTKKEECPTEVEEKRIDGFKKIQINICKHCRHLYSASFTLIAIDTINFNKVHLNVI